MSFIDLVAKIKKKHKFKYLGYGSFKPFLLPQWWIIFCFKKPFFRLYILVCFIPFVISDNIVSMYMAIVYLICRDETEMTINIMKTVVAGSSQMIRWSFLFFTIERVIATRFFETYKLSSNISLFWFLTVCTYAATIIQTGIGVCGKKIVVFVF